MEPVLVVVYSYSGVSRQLARSLCWQFGWPMGEVVELPGRGERRTVLRCLLDSLLRAAPPIGYRGPSPAGFRTVVLVSPVWALRLASPMRSFVAGEAANLRRVALVTTSADAHASADAVDEVSRLTGHPLLACTGFGNEDVRQGRCGVRLRELGRAFAAA